MKPWITPGLLRCIRHRDKLYKKLTKNPENNLCYIKHPSRMSFLHTFALFDTDESEVEKIITTLKNDCATELIKYPVLSLRNSSNTNIITYIYSTNAF